MHRPISNTFTLVPLCTLSPLCTVYFVLPPLDTLSFLLKSSHFCTVYLVLSRLTAVTTDSLYQGAEGVEERPVHGDGGGGGHPG